MPPGAVNLLAHQGAWDEVLYFVVPAIAVIVWVRWAEKRARAKPDSSEPSPGREPPPDE
jgi:hypothetical protein